MHVARPIVVALLLTGCAGAAVIRDNGTVCEPVAGPLAALAARDARAARQIVACANRRGELDALARLLRRRPASPGREHALGLTLAAGDSRGWREAGTRLGKAFEQSPATAAYSLRLGLFLLEAELYGQAVRPLHASVLADPASTGARVALAGALFESGKAAEAREVLRPLPRLNPSARDVKRGRAILQRAFGLERNSPARVRAIVRQARALLGTDDDAGRALEVLQQAALRFPAEAALHTMLGLAHVRLGNQADAVSSLQRSAELDPEVALSRLQLGELYSGLGQADSARRELEAAIERDPLSLDAYSALGELSHRERAYDEAAGHFRRLAVLDGRRVETLLKLGRALLGASRRGEAQRVYEALIARGAESYEACMRLGEIYLERRLTAPTPEDSERYAVLARRYLAMALEVRPHDPLVQRMLAELEPPR